MIRRDIIINLSLSITFNITSNVILSHTKNYNLFTKSNQAGIETSKLITLHQNVSNDFENAIIYISTHKNSPSQAYLNTYGKGLWEINFDIMRLKMMGV